MAVMDTSVYVSLYSPHEPTNRACWRWLEMMRERRELIVAPVVLVPEVSAALSRGSGNPELAHRITVQLAQSQLFELAPIDADLAIAAAQIAAEYRIRGCDSLFVALAQWRNDSLCTLDRQQLERGADVVHTYMPE